MNECKLENENQTCLVFCVTHMNSILNMNFNAGLEMLLHEFGKRYCQCFFFVISQKWWIYLSSVYLWHLCFKELFPIISYLILLF